MKPTIAYAKNEDRAGIWIRIPVSPVTAVGIWMTESEARILLGILTEYLERHKVDTDAEQKEGSENGCP